MVATSTTNQSFFRALYLRPFALLWTGQTLSRLGDFLYEIALAWWVLEKTGSAAAMASVFIFTLIPTILFSLVGGVAVDRYPRVPLMVSADVIRGVFGLLAAGLALSNLLEIWHVYALSMLFGLVDAFFQPAYTATIPAVVPDSHLASANSLTSMSIQIGRIAGPPLGALLIAFGGVEFVFGMNGLSFLFGAILLVPLWHLKDVSDPADSAEVESEAEEENKNENEGWQGFRRDVQEGLQIVRQTPWLWISILVFAFTNVTLAGPYSVSLPFLVKDNLQADVAVLGWLYAMFAGGYLLSGIWFGRQNSLQNRGRKLYGGSAVAGLMLALFGFPVIGFWALAAAALLNGFMLQMSMLAWTQTLQELIPRDKLGRVVSIDNLGSFALLPVGFGIAGWATELFGAPLMFLVGGSVTAVICFALMYHPAVKELDV